MAEAEGKGAKCPVVKYTTVISDDCLSQLIFVLHEVHQKVKDRYLSMPISANS